MWNHNLTLETYFKVRLMNSVATKQDFYSDFFEIIWNTCVDNISELSSNSKKNK